MLNAQEVREKQILLMGDVIQEIQESILNAIQSGKNGITHPIEDLTKGNMKLLRRYLIENGFEVHSYSDPQELVIMWF